MLGWQVRGDRKVHLEPRIPEQLGRIRMTRVHALGELWDVEAIGNKGYVRLSA